MHSSSMKSVFPHARGINRVFLPVGADCVKHLFPPPRHSQILAIKVACSNGLPECLEMVESKFGDWMNNGTNK